MMERPLDANAPIVWDKRYEIGIGSVDSEHRVLFYAYNTFISARSKGQGRLSVGYAISFLDDYLKYHFRNEEDLMARSNYDRFEAHKQDHVHLQDEFEHLKSQFAMDAEIDESLLAFFKGWILRHVVEDDRDIGVYLRSKERYRMSPDPATISQDNLAGSVGPALPSVAPGYGLTNRNGRVFKRYDVKLPGIVVNQIRCENPVIVTNISLGGARISGIHGMFREAVGMLSIPSLSLPDMSFIVISAADDECTVWFTIPFEKQVALEDVLRSPGFASLGASIQGMEDSELVEDTEGTDGESSGIADIGNYL